MAARGIKVHFPNVRMNVRPHSNFITSKGVVTFNTQLNQTKYEVKEYLEKVYGIGVIKVNTQVYAGKWKRDIKRKQFRQPAYKKAIVTIDTTSILSQLNQHQPKLSTPANPPPPKDDAESSAKPLPKEEE